MCRARVVRGGLPGSPGGLPGAFRAPPGAPAGGPGARTACGVRRACGHGVWAVLRAVGELESATESAQAHEDAAKKELKQARAEMDQLRAEVAEGAAANDLLDGESGCGGERVVRRGTPPAGTLGRWY